MLIRFSGKAKGILRFVLWVLVHALAVWLAITILGSQNITDFWLTLLSAGLVITIVAQSYRSLTYKQKFRIDGALVKWFIIHTIAFWVMNDLVMPRLDITNTIAYFLVFGLGIALMAKVSKKIEFGSRHHKSYHSREIPGWLIWVIIIGIGAALFIVPIPYGEPKSVGTTGLFCQDGKVMKQSGGLLGDLMGATAEMGAAFSCIEYKSSQCRLVCIDNEPHCQCQAKIWDILFHTPGDWIFGR